MKLFLQIVTSLVGVLVALYIFARASETTSGIEIGGSYIAGQNFTLAEWDKDGSRLYFGGLDGRGLLKITSTFDLSDPFIDLNGRLLFSEKRGSGENTLFRLLEVTVRGGRPLCRVLLQSKDSIQTPIVYVGSDPETILFFSGTFNPQATGGSVGSVSLYALASGQVKKVLHTEFPAMNSLSQISGNSFFGVSPFQSVSNDPGFFQIDLRGAQTSTARLISPLQVHGDVGSATYNPHLRVFHIRSYEHSPDLSVTSTVVDATTLESVRTLDLPRGWDYGDAFVDETDPTGETVVLLGVPRNDDQAPRIVTLFALEGEGLRELRSFPLEAVGALSSDRCSA